jgi:16S rRNA (guanine1207-N2)-methyltransferase
MSRWAQDPEGAADRLILRRLDAIAVSGTVLAVNQSRSLPEAVRARGAACVVWNRRLVPGVAGTAPWPPPGPFDGPYDAALVRLPKARDEQAMTVHAGLSVLRPGARLVLYGGNDEGIRSAAGLLAGIAADVATLAVRGHGRVLAARRSSCRGEAAGALRGSLAAWRTLSRIELAGESCDWVSYPGCFAAGRLDEGTRLLLTALPALSRGARVLDYACGTGVVAAALLRGAPGLAVDALDNDAVALAAARENVPAANLILGTRLADAPSRDYAAILCNPPLHQGIAEDRTLVERLIAEAPSRLAPQGCLQLVVQRRVAVDRLLGRHFAEAEVVAETGRYRVWRARTEPA